MLPPPESTVPALVFFIVAGAVHALIPVRMYSYWKQLNELTGRDNRRVVRGAPDDPAGVRLVGILIAVGASAMLAFYLWQHAGA